MPVGIAVTKMQRTRQTIEGVFTQMVLAVKRPRKVTRCQEQSEVVMLQQSISSELESRSGAQYILEFISNGGSYRTCPLATLRSTH
jgi:hypothetical protein